MFSAMMCSGVPATSQVVADHGAGMDALRRRASAPAQLRDVALVAGDGPERGPRVPVTDYLHHSFPRTPAWHGDFVWSAFRCVAPGRTDDPVFRANNSWEFGSGRIPGGDWGL